MADRTIYGKNIGKIIYILQNCKILQQPQSLKSPFIYPMAPWKVREMTSSCCSFVSLQKFTA